MTLLSSTTPIYAENLVQLNPPIIDGGADYIERNAMAHIALYQHLNAELTANNSAAELVIVGPSMGGQISRYALAYMEKNNIPHNTRLWVSVDSPHLGANIPMGAQTLVNVLNNFADSVEAQDFVEKQLGSAAAKQQLIEQHQINYIPFPFPPYQFPQPGYDYLDGRTISQGFSQDKGHPFFKQYYDNLFSNGLTGSRGYPQNLRKIAMVNGSLTNSTQFDNPFENLDWEFSGTAVLDNYSSHGAQTFKIEGDADVIGHIVTMETYFMPDTGSNHKIAYFKKYGLGGWNYYNRFIDNDNSRGNMDNVPGGWFPTQRDLAKSIDTSVPCEWVLLGNICVTHWDIEKLEHVSSFIPTVSALGFKDPNINWKQEFDRNLVCTQEIPFDNYFGPNKNEQHTSFTQRSVTWLLEELSENGIYPQPTVYLNAGDMNGPTVICGTSTVTYGFNHCKSPPVLDWELSGNLQEVVPFGPAPDNSIKVTPTNPSVNGWAYIKAIFASPNAPVQKNIWIGPPKVESVETVSILDINHTMPISYPDGCDEIGLKLNIEPSFDNVQEMEWEKVTTNYQWTQDPPGYDDEYTIIAPLCNDIVFKVRMQNDCGWSDWEEIEYDASNCGDCDPGGGGGGTIVSDYFEIWPNPVDTTLHVIMIGSDPTDLLMAGETLNIKLFNSLGTMVYNLNAMAEQNHIDVSAFPAGAYVLHINYSEQSPNLQTFQIIIE